MFTADEASVCPVCGMALDAVERLPPSYEQRVEEAQRLAETPPEHRTVPLWYYRRGRGALVLLAVLGLAAFFQPWVELSRPDEVTFTGWELARSRGAWFLGGAVAWLVSIPLVLSRRTVFRMRGVRAILALFASLTPVEIVQLLLNPPRGGRYVPVSYDWAYGLWLSLGIGVVGVIVAARFGGRLDDIDSRELAPEPAPELSPDQSAERTLH